MLQKQHHVIAKDKDKPSGPLYLPQQQEKRKRALDKAREKEVSSSSSFSDERVAVPLSTKGTSHKSHDHNKDKGSRSPLLSEEVELQKAMTVLLQAQQLLPRAQENAVLAQLVDPLVFRDFVNHVSVMQKMLYIAQQHGLRFSLSLGLFAMLPREMIVHLLSFLTANELWIVRQVCTLFRDVSMESSLWKRLCLYRFRHESEEQLALHKRLGKSWEWLYKSKARVFLEKQQIGNYSGPATFISTNGQIYTGDWQNGEPHGKGTKLYPSGNRYEGDLERGKFCGYGVINYADGGQYIGSWKDNSSHGKGVRTFASGNRYDGEFKDGQFHGTGTFTWADGEKYVGEWREGDMHGEGVKYFNSGNKYQGSFENDGFHGYGIFTWASGEKYMGEWRVGNMHGQGVKHFIDGRKYDGHWEADKRDGKGTLHFPTGERYEGKWKQNKMLGGKLYRKDGRVLPLEKALVVLLKENEVLSQSAPIHSSSASSHSASLPSSLAKEEPPSKVVATTSATKTKHVDDKESSS
ncbi:Molecular chaperone Tir [Balamuthia mandrillaris]